MPVIAQLDERMIQQIREILVRRGVTRAVIFGSFARGEANEVGILRRDVTRASSLKICSME